ncbi:MAG: hypothetical protein ABID64_04730 [Nitrospirota bacterium]
MGNNSAEKAAGIIISDDHVCEGYVPGIDDPSIRIVDDLGAYESEEGLLPGPGEILGRGDLIRIKAQIELALTSAAPISVKEICEIIMPIASNFNLPSLKTMGGRQNVVGTGSLPEDSQDVIEYLSPGDKKYAVVVTTSYVRIYCKVPLFNWILVSFSTV